MEMEGEKGSRGVHHPSGAKSIAKGGEHFHLRAEKDVGHDGKAEEASDEHEEEVVEVGNGRLDRVVDDGKSRLEAIVLEAAQERPGEVARQKEPEIKRRTK
eukprot:752987-Hanusia_phi.AAC.3